MCHWTIHLEGEHRKDQAAVVVGHKIYCFGTDRNQRCIAVQVFNTASLCWRKLRPLTPGTGERTLEVPSWRKDHTAVLIEDNVYLWGGWTLPGYCNVLYAFDVDAHIWFKPQVSGTVPDARYGHLACVLGKVMYIHGGTTKITEMINDYDMYKFDTSTMVWSVIRNRPTSLGCHSATTIGTKMFVFGGYMLPYYRYSKTNTISVFDTDLWLKTPSTQPPPGRHYSDSHSAFSYNEELYIFVGRYHQPFYDLWKFSPESFCWKKVEPKGKGPHRMQNMCCCMMGDRMILFGADNRPGDLYVLDFSPSLKTLCKLAVIQYGLEQSELPHNIRWELAAITSKG